MYIYRGVFVRQWSDKSSGLSMHTNYTLQRSNIRRKKTGVQLCSNAVNANAAVPASGLRQKYNNATLTNIPHATLTAGDRCFFRCTMDGSGNILSDNYVDTAMSPGYTWYYIGNATSASAINHDTTQSMFYTLDANGKLTHINGLPIAT